MKLAIISDLHADVHALRDALAQIERLGCDEIVCAGDVLDWGLFPERTIRCSVSDASPRFAATTSAGQCPRVTTPAAGT